MAEKDEGSNTFLGFWLVAPLSKLKVVVSVINAAVVSAINKGSAQDPSLSLSRLLCIDLGSFCAVLNITMAAHYLSLINI